jgi:hypothetical protein
VVVVAAAVRLTDWAKDTLAPRRRTVTAKTAVFRVAFTKLDRITLLLFLLIRLVD